MRPTKEGIRQAINAYFTQNPNGLDVTAFVLNSIGHEDMERDAKTTHRSLDQAKQEMGRMVSEELLPQMFSGVEALCLVKVDGHRWPNLAGWVTSYTQHRVGRRL
jgi:hypothetical protein